MRVPPLAPTTIPNLYTLAPMPDDDAHDQSLLASIRRGALAIGAFALATGVFLCFTRAFRFIPPTPDLGIGRVTLDGASKAREYVVSALFYLIVPLTTFLAYAGAQRADRHFALRVARSSRGDVALVQAFTTLLLAAPLLLSPFLYLTTRKEGWTIILPVAIGWAGPACVAAWLENRWIRQLFARELWQAHALLLLEGSSWILFRYLTTGHRIAHIPTLFLEVVFLAFFLGIFWAAAVLVSRAAAFAFDQRLSETLPRFATGAVPLLSLPLLGMTLIAPQPIVVAVFLLTATGVALALFTRTSLAPASTRRLLVWVAIPLFVFCAFYSSSATLWNWIDVFHRGESLGPASDLLRGKVPYRDVFILHGLLDDGFLDATLMQWFGRDVDVSTARVIVLDTLINPVLWYLAIVIFDSIPLGILVVALSLVTTGWNQRALLEVVAVALVIAALRRGKPWLAFAAGAVSVTALFQSLDMGIYSIAGGAAAFVAAAFFDRRTGASVRPSLMKALAFAAGVAAGAAPWLVYLGSRGALGDFITTSFVTVPAIIDPVWSLPFPDLVKSFGDELTLKRVADFLLGQEIRFVLNPLVLGIAAAYLVFSYARRRFSALDSALLPVTIVAVVTQRSAIGRADFPHQYFAAFLLPAILTILLVLLFRHLAEMWRRGGPESKAFLSLLVLAPVPLIATMLWIPDLVSARLDQVLRYRDRIWRRADADEQSRLIAQRLGLVTRELDRIAKEGAPMFDFSNQPAFYFFANRPNPTRFYQIPIVSPLRFQREVIERLEATRTPLILRRSPEGFDNFDGIPNDVRAAAVAAYIDDRYVFHKKVRGVEIWTRKPARPAFVVDQYLDIARRLDRKAAAGKEIFIFPSVASLAGANGSQWRTDLTIHNPFDSPVSLRLRYFSDTPRQVTIRVGGRGTAVWHDVVRSLFAATGTRGALWIEYPKEMPPSATARTFDATKGTKGSVDRPFSLSDAAQEKQQLLLTGIPGAGRRVNIGVVNVGDTGARYRFWATTLSGTAIGEPYVRASDEYESFLLVDANAVLGVPIDESIIVHVSLLSGSAIGYASIIDPATGDSQTLPAIPSSP